MRLWGRGNGIVLEGTEWNMNIEHEESCEYDEFGTIHTTVIGYYEYDCGADVYYNYSVDGFGLF